MNLRMRMRTHARKPAGYNSGRPYQLAHIRTEGTSKSDTEAVDAWIQCLRNEKEKANKRQRITKIVLAFQGRIATIFNSTLFQGFMALLILLNFILSAVQLQIHPESGTQMYRDFENVDMLFTMIFTFELGLNLLAHWFWPFWSSGWNVFGDRLLLSLSLSLPLSLCKCMHEDTQSDVHSCTHSSMHACLHTQIQPPQYVYVCVYACRFHHRIRDTTHNGTSGNGRRQIDASYPSVSYSTHFCSPRIASQTGDT